MLGDIASGNTGAADVLFLIALILAIVGALAYLVANATRFAPSLVALSVGAIAFGFLLL